MDIFDLMASSVKDSLNSNNSTKENFNYRDLSSIIDNEALAYALYTLEERAVPNMVDGFKPVHRFIINRGLGMARGNKDKFHKMASLAGGVADLGYHHGEVNAQEAGALMANNWNNNVPFMDGQGNFGSRLVRDAAQARYIFARVSDNFRDLYKDTEYAPTHDDLEHVPPKFYLPIIPTVLLNGIKGIATGYATDILPHSLASLKECTIAALNGTLDKEPEVSYPQFRGKIVNTEPGKYELQGTYEMVSRTVMRITEIPYKYDRASYIEILDKLEDQGFITYDDECGKNGFAFKIKFRKDYILSEDDEERHNKIMKDFKLTESRTQNLTVIGADGKLKEYEKASDLVRDFVEVRKGYIQLRIENKIKETQDAFQLALAKAQFIKAVIDEKIIIQKKTRAQLTEEIKQYSASFAPYADALVSMNIYHITSDEARKLAEKAKEMKEENDYWRKTTVTIEYTKDLEAI